GVDLREPLKPIMPADDHDTALPCWSVMVMIVLLKVAATCATPTTTFFFSFLRARPAPAFFSAAGAAIGLLGHFLLAGDGLRGALARACIGVGALAADGKAAAMAQAAIAAEIHQALDVHRHFAAQIAFDEKVAVDRLADLDDLGVGQVVDAALRRDADLVADLLGRADAMDVAQADHDPLLGGNIDAGDTCHVVLRFGSGLGLPIRLDGPRS